MSENASASALKKFKSSKILEILIILIVVVIVAIVVYNFVSGRKSKETVETTADYGTELEKELSQVLSAIDGAGEVSVMISFSDNGEIVIAMQTTTLEDGTVVTEPVLIDGEVVVLEERKPEISGVLIVAAGANDLRVRFDILSATASVLNINQSLIKVYTKG